MIDLINETNRLCGALNQHLADHEFIAEEYSIADMAAYPWIVPEKINTVPTIPDDEARKTLFGQTAASLHKNT